MKLAYVTIFEPIDIHAWSGLGVYILTALQQAGFETETTGSLVYQHDYIYKTKEVLYTSIFHQKYRMLWDPILLKGFAAQVKSALKGINPDVVFSIWTNPIAYLKTDKPLIFWGDATLAGLMEHYPAYRKLSAETVRDGNKAEQLALSRCRLAIYSSDWAANTAIQNYDVDPAKVKVVPFGANINCDRDRSDIQAILNHKHYDVCRLLFIGVEWLRKGGDMAISVAERLNRRRIPTELHLVGCNPPGDLPGFVKAHGFISKTTQVGRQQLGDLFSQSHFFILPTRADCTPVVFPEACSFGLPSLATDVGGITTVIRDGKNGFIFPLDASPDDYCDTIQRLWSSRQAYEQLALSSFKEYSERLNWATAGKKVADLIHEYCG